MIVVPWVVGLPYLNRQNTVQAKYVFEYTRIDVQICVYSEQVSTRSPRSVARLLPVPKICDRYGYGISSGNGLAGSAIELPIESASYRCYDLVCSLFMLH